MFQDIGTRKEENLEDTKIVSEKTSEVIKTEKTTETKKLRQAPEKEIEVTIKIKIKI